MLRVSRAARRLSSAASSAHVVPPRRAGWPTATAGGAALSGRTAGAWPPCPAPSAAALAAPALPFAARALSTLPKEGGGSAKHGVDGDAPRGEAGVSGRSEEGIDGTAGEPREAGAIGDTPGGARATAPAPDSSGWSREEVLTLANVLSLSRIVASPVLAWLIIEGRWEATVPLLTAAALTDWLDGIAARTARERARARMAQVRENMRQRQLRRGGRRDDGGRSVREGAAAEGYGTAEPPPATPSTTGPGSPPAQPARESTLGSYLDPLADKVLIASVVGALGVSGALPPALVAVVLARDVALVGGAFVIRARQVGWTWPGASEFFRTRGSSAAIAVRPLMISKVNTCLQLALVGGAVTGAAYGWPSQDALWMVGAATATTTVLSFLAYARMFFAPALAGAVRGKASSGRA